MTEVAYAREDNNYFFHKDYAAGLTRTNGGVAPSPFDVFGDVPLPRFPDALCRTVDGDLWFTPERPPGSHGKHGEDQAREARAVNMCYDCPHMLDCADYAVQYHIPYGVWGGLTEADRMTIWAQDEQEQAS